MADKKRIAVVRVRGSVRVRGDTKDTLRLMNLTRVNHCTLIDNGKEYLGMLQKAKDYITWGEIKPETMEKLLQKRGKLVGDKKLTEDYMKETKYKSIKKFVEEFMDFKAELRDLKEMKPVFRLNPPVKGYDRGGIKKPYKLGGALGYRGEKINELIEKMI